MLGICRSRPCSVRSVRSCCSTQWLRTTQPSSSTSCRSSSGDQTSSCSWAEPFSCLNSKAERRPTGDIDQAAGYVRDLRAYHRECADRPVHGAVVLGQASGYVGEDVGVHVLGLDAVDDLAERLDVHDPAAIVTPGQFLAANAYRPLPSLVESARSLFESGELPRINRAAAATEPALSRISELIHEAARTQTRRLILLTGVPGSGKTLVGLQVAHARWLDDLAVDRGNGKPSAPAVFLSGNGPLVEVLQYELKGAGGGGKAFVRGVKEYVPPIAAVGN